MECRIIDLGSGKYIKQIKGDYVEGRKEPSPPSTSSQHNQSESNTNSQPQSPKNHVEMEQGLWTLATSAIGIALILILLQFPLVSQLKKEHLI